MAVPDVAPLIRATDLYLSAVLDGAIRQIDVNRIHVLIHPHAQGLVLSK
jgi:hypothetical protein